MDYSDFAFGFSISGAVVTVNAGKIIHGKRLPIIVSSKEITVNNDMTYIFVHYVIGALSGTIDSSNIFPSCTETTLDLPLHLWRVNNGVVSIADGGILHLGYFILPEIFS